jgi:hypothetical protein
MSKTAIARGIFVTCAVARISLLQQKFAQLRIVLRPAFEYY